MLPPALVLTIKNYCAGWMFSVFVTVSCALMIGCSPPGPRLLLQGKQFIEEGRYQEAINRLEKATELLPKHPLAWNYLGLAYHANHQLDEASKAYRLALSLDHKLTAVRYNLGCLFLEQGKYSAAIDELHSYTLLQPSVIDGWIKQGTALLNARRLDEAEKSFRVALELQARHPEALNGLGLVQVQRRRLQDALNHFNVAALQSPPYGPALLNSAIVNQQLNNPTLALQRYRQYLTQQIRPADADAVAAVIEQLELATNSPRVVSRTPPVTSVSVPDLAKTNAMVAQAGSTSRTSLVASLRPQTSPARINPPSAAGKDDFHTVPYPSARGGTSRNISNAVARVPAVAPASKISTPRRMTNDELRKTNSAMTNRNRALGALRDSSSDIRHSTFQDAEASMVKPDQLEVTELRSNLVVRPAQELTRATPVPPMPAASSVAGSKADTNGVKRGFFSRLNPFSRKRSGATGSADQTDSAPPGASSAMRQGTRYLYLSPAAPTTGNPVESDKAFNRGLKAQKSGSLSLAVTEYQAADRKSVV